MSKEGRMKKSLCIVWSALALSGCAAVYTDASDANHVTFLNSSDESMSALTQKANNYCQQFGKTASFRSSDTQLLVVFDCQLAR